MPRRQIAVEVTQHDIDRAVRADSSHCVVATAVARAVPDATRIEVDTQCIRFTSDGKRLAYLTPMTVQGYVVAFDAGDPIAPFAFKLREPIELRRKHVLDGSKSLAAAAERQHRANKKLAKAAALTPGDTNAPPLVPTTVSYAGIKTAVVSEPGQRRPPPRVFKTKKRSYGHRLLRINRAKENPTFQSQP